MDLDLPKLDIVEDIEEIMEDDETEAEPEPQEIISPEEHMEALKIEEEKRQPFVKKEVKKKRELSEKQKAHLEKIRGMALEKRKAKAAAKKAAVDKVVSEVKEQHKPKYYKPKPKKTAEEKALEREAKKKYKKQTMEVQENNIKTEVEETTPKDFVPSHKEKQREKKEQEALTQQQSFVNFMGNMEMYLKMRDAHAQKKLENNQNDVMEKKQPVKKEAKPKVSKKPEPVPSILQAVDENPFSNYFG
jgi:hypothetical protein